LKVDILPKKLVVIESPGKIKTFKKILGSDYDIISSFGHIRDLPPKKIGVDIKNNFTPTYENILDKKEVIKTIKDHAKKSEIVFIMTDDDREGSRIAKSVAEIIPSGIPIKRAKANSITKNAILAAIANANDMSVDDNLLEAQEARRIVDRICGYKTSFLTKQSTGGKSAGRVQSIALRLLAEREKEIKNFVPEEYWEITASLLSPKDEQFQAKLSNKTKIPNENKAKQIYDEIKKRIPIVKSITTKLVSMKPYPPFVTQSLTSSAKTNFGWQNSTTMKVAQDLYESGKITYLRTDSYSLDEGSIIAIRDYVNTYFGSEYVPGKPNFYKNKKSAQAAHTAIHPTDIFVPSVQSGNNQKLYELIWKRTAASQSIPSEEKKVRVIIDIAGYDFIANGKLIIFDGWKKIYDYIKSEDILLPDLKKGDECKWDHSK